MRRAIATTANFFFPGAGYLIAGVQKTLAPLWLIGVIGLTVVELGIRDSEPGLYALMFASVLVMNMAFAIDVWRKTADDAAAIAPNRHQLATQP